MATDEFRKEKGAVASRFCGNCHEPLLVAERRHGSADRCAARAPRRPGVTCLVCHSIDPRRSRGQRPLPGRPAAGADGAGDARRARAPAADESGAVLRRLPQGRPRRRRHAASAGCAARTTTTPGTSAPSPATAPARSIAPRPRKICQDCHMPLEPAVLGDAARQERHGPLAPLPRREHAPCRTCAATPSRRRAPPRTCAARASLALIWSGPPRVDALMRARGVGHRFPGGTMDSNEVWLEVTALDAARQGCSAGRARAARDGTLDADTHLVRAQPVDAGGRPLLRRDPAAHARRRLRRRAGPVRSAGGALRGAARHGARRGAALYRKFSPAYARVRLRRPAGARAPRCLDLPVVEIAAAELAAGAPPPADPALSGRLGARARRRHRRSRRARRARRWRRRAPPGPRASSR